MFYVMNEFQNLKNEINLFKQQNLLLQSEMQNLKNGNNLSKSHILLLQSEITNLKNDIIKILTQNTVNERKTFTRRTTHDNTPELTTEPATTSINENPRNATISFLRRRIQAYACTTTTTITKIKA